MTGALCSIKHNLPWPGRKQSLLLDTQHHSPLCHRPRHDNHTQAASSTGGPFALAATHATNATSSDTSRHKGAVVVAARIDTLEMDRVLMLKCYEALNRISIFNETLTLKAGYARAGEGGCLTYIHKKSWCNTKHKCQCRCHQPWQQNGCSLHTFHTYVSASAHWLANLQVGCHALPSMCASQ